MHTDQVVEERRWMSGVEVVSHVNHSQLARVRAALGWSVPPRCSALAELEGGRPPLAAIRVEPRWRRRAIRPVDHEATPLRRAAGH